MSQLRKVVVVPAEDYSQNVQLVMYADGSVLIKQHDINERKDMIWLDRTMAEMVAMYLGRIGQ